MINYMFALFVITSLDSGDYKYTHIKTYSNELNCEVSAFVFKVEYGPFQDNETIECIKVDS